jgi:hypothetical protein
LEEELKKSCPGVKTVDSDTPFADILETAMMSHKKPFLYAPESYRKAYREQYEKFTEYFKFQLKTAVENLKVSVFFSKVWFINFFRNMLTAERRPDCFYPDISGPVTDWPALVVASGPSLNGKLKEIREVRDRCLIIAVLSSARTLLKNGIEPDLIIASDAGVGNKMHAIGIPGNIPVLANIYASSSLLTGLPNPVVFYNLKEEMSQLSFTLKFPSVTMDAGNLALALTTGPVVFCGFDLGYDTHAGSHSAGNAFLEFRASSFNRLTPYFGTLTSFMKRRDVSPMENGGGRWYTQTQFRMVKKNVEDRFGGLGYTGEGSVFAGLKKAGKLKDVFAAGREKEKKAEMEKIRNTFVKYSDIRQHLTRLLDNYKKDFAAANSEMSRRVLLRENLAGMDVRKAKDYIYTKIDSIAGK